MYLNSKLIKYLKIKNIILAVATAFSMTIAIYWEFYLVIRYWGDMYTVIHAAATPDFIRTMIIGTILLIYVTISAINIGNANFYSSYFEEDLDGIVSAEDLSEVLGKRAKKILRQLKFYSRIYMTNYKIEGENAVLASKTVECECINCGGHFDKKIYFNGECPYCGSSDLRAKVLTSNRFYCISNEVKGEAKNYRYYLIKPYVSIQLLQAVLLVISLIGVFIFFCSSTDYFTKINDREYILSILFDPSNDYYSYDIIRYDLISTVIMGYFFAAALSLLCIFLFVKTFEMQTSLVLAHFFSTQKDPFIKPSTLPICQDKPVAVKIKRTRKAIRSGYLKHTTIEKHSRWLKVVLGKKVVKDKCPYCGAPIVGAVYRDHKCKYCNRKIMNVIVKK